jgi:membrane dipeptidase
MDVASQVARPHVAGSEHARALLKELLVWDAHGGFTCKPDQDLSELSRWEEVHVDYLSINIGFDIHPWEHTVKVVAAYRHWLAQRPERFVLVETASDVLRAKHEGKLAVGFDLEGAVSLGGQLSMLALYHRLGVRQMHFVYNLNNEAGGGCHDQDTGLTPYGRDLVREANRLGILLDLSHVGYQTSLDICASSTAPVVFSHSNPKAMVDHPRNITDDQMRACVATGGVVAVNGLGRFLGDPAATADSFVKAIDMTVERVGVENVAIGLDYTWAPGGSQRAPTFWPPQHYSGKYAYLGPHQLPETVDLLLALGYSEVDLRRILGENFFRVAARVWGTGRIPT